MDDNHNGIVNPADEQQNLDMLVDDDEDEDDVPAAEDEDENDEEEDEEEEDDDGDANEEEPPAERDGSLDGGVAHNPDDAPKASSLDCDLVRRLWYTFYVA